ncbi:MarR family winged helix-turn-helix transcriptional regulator [Thaumasiovibrio subtropicus]|uniref:MarR family winged helix-turn-helix transcriptional regulator n=1 Tax=Thaumasiovibrio subtropicus TaxID=1891207 RepID=UPI000B356E36|nr:MarR family transcriptional regulator [Thaumasiovibrio subtropicus]
MANQTPADTIDLIIEQWQQEKPQLNTLPMAMLGRMKRLAAHSEKAIADCHKQFGIKLGEFDVLATLLRSGQPYTLTPSVLFKTMMLSSGAMTNRLDRLEEKGLITRAHSKDDRRSVTVSLTDEGKALIEEAIVAHVKVQESLVAGITTEDQHAFSELSKRWLISLKHDADLPQD